MKRIIWQLWQSSWFWPERLERYSIYNALLEAREWAQGEFLDVGCGKKPYAPLFIGQIKAYIGLDYPTTVVSSDEAMQDRPDVFGDASSMSFRDHCFDTVLCTQVLEHIPEPWKSLDEIARVLKPGGVLIMTVPQEWGIHRAPYDFYRYTRYGIAYLVQRSGLIVELLRARGGYWVMMGQRVSGYLNDSCLLPLSRRKHRCAFAIAAAFVLPLCAFAQCVGLVLDHIQPLTSNTLGYLVIARKPND